MLGMGPGRRACGREQAAERGELKAGMSVLYCDGYLLLCDGCPYYIICAVVKLLSKFSYHASKLRPHAVKIRLNLLII
jgi:hypothetical protein